MNLFYFPDAGSPRLTLDREESRHLVKVLRHKEGHEVFITDGKGGWFTARISGADPNGTELEIIKREMRDPLKPNLHIAIAPTKNIDRFEWFLEKATEIGISEITPLICEHSEREVVKADRLEKVLVAAMKQSLSAWLPVLHPAISFKKFISSAHQGNLLLASASAGIHMKSACNPGEDCIILVGPEGDFSPDEVRMAMENKFTLVSLGNSRLRTETAGVVAVSCIRLLNA